MTFFARLLQRATRSRLLVLGVALTAGLVCALATGEDGTRFEPLVGDAVAAERVRIEVAADTKDAAAKQPAETSEAPAKSRPGVDATISIGEQGVRIRNKQRDSDEPQVVVDDLEFDSFEQFVEKAPWLAALMFMVVALVFLMPLLIIVAIIWYKMRSNRMRNEMMLKLAERGIVPPADAMAAMAPGSAAASLAALPSTAPLYEQVKQVRRRAAWSDLRKGVIMGGIGLGLTFWSMLDEGSANGFGLVLLFVGIGYVVLWYFEDRKISRSGETGSGSTPGA